jgi:phosphohistidine phosphatase
MNLYIMRHGESSWDTQIDSERSLTDFGQQQATAVGQYLSEANISVDLVMVSPYKRAQQTANKVLDKFPLVKTIESSNFTPESSVAVAQESVEAAGDKNILLISHLPLVANLAGYLTADDSASRGQHWSPATIACLRGDDFLPGCMIVQWIKSPNELVEKL